MAHEREHTTITNALVVDPPPLDDFDDGPRLAGRLSSAGRREITDQQIDPSLRNEYRVAVAPKEVSAVAKVEQRVVLWDPDQVAPMTVSDPRDGAVTNRAAYEVSPLLNLIQRVDPANPVIKNFANALRSAYRWPAIGSILLRWVMEEGEVVDLERIHHPVPVVAGAVPAQTGANGELTTAFEVSKSKGIEVTVAAAGAGFAVKYSVADERSVVLPESPTGGLVVGIGSLLIPLDREVRMVPMAHGGETFPVVRYLPVPDAADLVGWESGLGSPDDVDRLSLGLPVPLRGGLPQKDSNKKAVNVDATVSLGWENKTKGQSVKAALGISTKATLGMSWELPAGSFDLRWVGRGLGGAVIRPE